MFITAILKDPISHFITSIITRCVWFSARCSSLIQNQVCRHTCCSLMWEHSGTVMSVRSTGKESRIWKLGIPWVSLGLDTGPTKGAVGRLVGGTSGSRVCVNPRTISESRAERQALLPGSSSSGILRAVQRHFSTMHYTQGARFSISPWNTFRWCLIPLREPRALLTQV